VSSTEAKHRGQYIQLAGAGEHFELCSQAAISFSRIARPKKKYFYVYLGNMLDNN
jgi:hypothetical protein